MHFEDRKPALDVRCIDGHLAIEAARTHQSGIQNIRTVGGRDDDDAAVALETIHFGEQLIEGLLALIVAAADAGTPLTADGIDLIDEDQAGAVFLGFLEQIPDTTGTDTDEHLDEFGT